MGRYSNWGKEQDQILLRTVNAYKSKKWIKTSFKLKEFNYNRSPSECRQRYINYLTPNIDKNQITQEELVTIYQKYEEIGPRWSIIQQYVKCKTQCKIKNVFYGNVKNLLKTVYKFFTFKTASFMNSISTDLLQSIYQGSLCFDGINQAKEGIKAMNYKNNKNALLRHILTDQEGYLHLLNSVLKQIFGFQPVKMIEKSAHHYKIERIIEKTSDKKMRRDSSQKQSSIDNYDQFQESEQNSVIAELSKNNPNSVSNSKIERSERKDASDEQRVSRQKSNERASPTLNQREIDVQQREISPFELNRLSQQDNNRQWMDYSLNGVMQIYPLSFPCMYYPFYY